MSAALQHRKARIGAVADARSDLLLGIIKVEEFDLGARRHDRADPPIAEPQRHLDDRRLGLRDMAGRHPLAQHEADLLVGDRRRSAAQRQQPQQEIGGRTQQPLDRRPHPRQAAHEAGQRRGDRLGSQQRQPLRHQFAEDQREVGDADDHDGHADGVRIIAERAAMRGKIVLQAFAERRLAESAG